MTSRRASIRMVLFMLALGGTAGLEAQTFSGVEPRFAAADGSTRVTFQGSGFPEAAMATIGGKPVEELRWVDSRTLTGNAPALGATEPAGPRDAAVQFGGRTGTVVLPNAISYFRPMSLQAVEPKGIPFGGGTPV